MKKLNLCYRNVTIMLQIFIFFILILQNSSDNFDTKNPQSQGASTFQGFENQETSIEAICVDFEKSTIPQIGDASAFQGFENKELPNKAICKDSGNFTNQQIGGASMFQGFYDLTQEEKDMLVKLVYLESRGEPYEGKKAVASIVMNRVESPYWGSDVETIIFAKRQFSPASKINTTTIGTDNVWLECVNAVEDVLQNGSTLPPYVLYFRADYYFKGKEQYTNIGNHYFSYTSKDKELLDA